MRIFIPTLGRPDRQKTLEALMGDKWYKTCGGYRVTMVCHKNETQAFLSKGLDAVTCPVQGRIGKVRQWILETSDDKKILMLDDDLSFFHRGPPREGSSGKFGLYRNSASDNTDMFRAIDRALDKYAHVSAAPREGCNHLETNAECIRMMRMVGMRADVLAREDIRYDRMLLMEDFDVNLSLLERGYASMTLIQWAHDQGSSAAPGGCSASRTQDSQRDAAIQLERMHHPFVTLREKRTKTAWKALGGVRLEPTIHWKKAYAAGVLIHGEQTP